MGDIDAIFKAYDVRGLAPEQLDADLCRAIGAAFARFVHDHDDAGSVVIGHDMRPTGPEFAHAFADGAMGQGLDVVHIGLVSTDMIYFASGRLNMPGAILTASHNPAEYNGIKLCRAGAGPLGGDTGLFDIREMARGGGPEPLTGTLGTLEHRDMLDEFADHVLGFIDVGTVRPLKVVADTANGMGGLVVPAIFDRLPFDLEVMYPELDGTFPNHPADPIQDANQVDLKKRVLETSADVGLAFDGDADRVFLVDANADGVSGSLTTALVARRVLEREPGASIIHNLICSKVVPEMVSEMGGTPIRSKVGHSYIKDVMADTGAAFGGEHSGHYYFRDNFRADSGLIAAVVVLAAICETGASLAELVAPLRRYAASGEINTRVSDTNAMIEQVSAVYADAAQDRLDGLTVDMGDWWFNLRASNTEPLLRLNLEASTSADTALRVAEVQGHMAR
ncbi:MAG: phosphomannomutase/phosphoglucomutase [Acidimicrobiales bacterium]